jgi:hypothetical protein
MYFLVAQFIALSAGGASFFAYMVKLETRVHTIETRGAEFTVHRMDQMTLGISKLETKIERNENSIERIIDVMTRELHISPGRVKQ